MSSTYSKRANESPAATANGLSKRARGLFTGGSEPDAGPSELTGKSSVWLESAERFSRLLFPRLRVSLDRSDSEAPAGEATKEAIASAEQAGPPPPQATPSAKAKTAPDESELASPPATEFKPSPLISWLAQPMRLNADQAPKPASDVSEDKSLATTGQADAEWAQDMTSIVKQLYLRSSPTMQNWTVTLALPPKALPDSSLRIDVWPNWMSLRFITSSPLSIERVSKHRQTLISLLSSSLDMPYDVDVDVT